MCIPCVNTMKNSELQTAVMPIVALRGLVVFPGAQMHFDVGRSKSIAAFKAAMSSNQQLFLVAQKSVMTDDPGEDDIFRIGVTATVRQILKMPGDDGIRVVIEGKKRAKLESLTRNKPYLQGEISYCPVLFSRNDTKLRQEALMRQVRDRFNDYANLVPDLPPDVMLTVFAEKEAGRLSDYIAGNILINFEDKQAVLEELNPYKRLQMLCVLIERESKILQLEDSISEKVQTQIDKNQREYYLREQMKVISTELGDGVNAEEEVENFRRKIKELAFDEAAEKKLLSECDRLDRMSPQSPESAVSRTYLETCLSLPWKTETKDKLDIKAARKVLDKDHYGMEKVKDRIIETLAVRKLSPDIKGQILCLVGPPGVGKTSIARSIATAMGRNYVRLSLGGVHDEAEIRGHRKTYIGSMPGRIINAIQQAGSNNPLMLLDEVDKLGNDYKGDPSSALLEVLDSEQNNTFRDHYIEIPFDLSRVFFITTANDASMIPRPLLDRMEIIELGSYTHEEKFNIAKRHLIPKQIERHGMSTKMIKIRDGAVRAIIDGYTREAGCRSLEREIAKLCRKCAVEVANGAEKLTVTENMLEDLLGPKKFKDESLSLKSEVGVTNGLAWTAVGGDMLKVEVLVLDGTGKLELTGSLGDVMKESAKAAVSFIRSRAEKLSIDTEFYKNKDIHIHVPDGAVPKDGPSAGVTITTSLVSALSGIPVKGSVAMTGEITLTGRVLPIGGLREKTMAAYRSGISTVIIPKDNEPDLAEVDDKVKANVRFVFAENLDTVLSEAMEMPNISTEKTQVIPAECKQTSHHPILARGEN